ncbi:MAG: metallophosphoesterase [Myxococcales bacterium]|nr:metallophosphoesterase [Myxococcales bacterium]
MTPTRRDFACLMVCPLLMLIGCNGPNSQTRASTDPVAAEAALSPAYPFKTANQGTLRMAIIGDYGDAHPQADVVAAMVRSWKPEMVVTVGDNNYPKGEQRTLDPHIGKRYGRFIKPYKGKYGPGASDQNRFFPALGNHDWYTAGAQPYFNWFELPGNERYYEVLAGPAHLLILDSDRHEPDGTDAESKQSRWFQRAIARSKSPFRFVFFHHPPYNSGRHRPSTTMRWPFAKWGATLTFAGHDHHYERIAAAGMQHIVTGHGGRYLYPYRGPVAAGSQVRVYGVWGAMRATISETFARFESITTENIVIDSFGVLPKHGPHAPKGKPLEVRPFGQNWHVLDAGKKPPVNWATATPLISWRHGRAPMGRGVSTTKTALSEGADDGPKTVHFRSALTIKKVPKWLRLRLQRDDGARVLINGTEVWRLNLPLGPITAATEAGYNLKWGNEKDVVDTWIPGGVLHAGVNELAVSLHQAPGAAHDAYFDLAIDTLD